MFSIIWVLTEEIFIFFDILKKNIVPLIKKLIFDKKENQKILATEFFGFPIEYVGYDSVQTITGKDQNIK